MTALLNMDFFLKIGILLILSALVLGIIELIIFYVKGKKLKKALEEDYGDPSKYNLKVRE